MRPASPAGPLQHGFDNSHVYVFPQSGRDGNLAIVTMAYSVTKHELKHLCTHKEARLGSFLISQYTVCALESVWLVPKFNMEIPNVGQSHSGHHLLQYIHWDSWVQHNQWRCHHCRDCSSTLWSVSPDHHHGLSDPSCSSLPSISSQHLMTSCMCRSCKTWIWIEEGLELNYRGCRSWYSVSILSWLQTWSTDGQILEAIDSVTLPCKGTIQAESEEWSLCIFKTLIL